MSMEVVGTKYTAVFGKVEEVRKGTGAAEGKVTNVKIAGTVWNGTENEEKTIDVAFWNNESSAMADRAAKGIKEGAKILILCTVKDGKYTGLRFTYRGQFIIEQEEDRKCSVTIGSVTHKMRDGKVRFSVPIDDYVDGQNSTKWIGVNFSAKRKDAAEKIFASGEESRLAVLIGFEPEVTEANGTQYTNMVAYQFELL